MSRRDSSSSYCKSRDLCFNESDFLKDSFDVDDFLREHRGKASLEMMRDDLGSYLKTLRMSMIELINEDYEDFVNLSKDLIGLDNAIHAVEVPLCQLMDEILEVKKDLDDTISSINNCLLERKQLTERKRSLSHLTQVITSLEKLKSIIKIDTSEQIQPNYNLDIIERAAMEYNQLQFSMFKCKNELVTNIKEDSEQVGKALMNILNKLFLDCFKRKQLNDLGRCLRIFAGLDKIKEAEDIVRQEVVQPFLNGLITEQSLQKENDTVVYDSVIKFIDLELQILLELTTFSGKTPVIKGYSFMINSLWPELEEKLEKNLPTILFSGNPKLFHSRFVNCKKLIEEIERRCGNKYMVIKFREHKKYQEFFQKWNLLVYFKMRFQEIAGQVESGLNEDKVLTDGVKDVNNFCLKPTVNVMMALEKCWTKEVYLPELAHMFWKLSLQIISRYTYWINQRIDNKKIELFEKGEMDMELSRNSHLDYLVCLFKDTKKVIVDSDSYLTKCKEQIPNNHLIESELSASLGDSIKSLEICLPKISWLIVNVITRKSTVHLSQISQIPRDFRRTNRESPTKPCEYVGSVLSLPIEFYKSKKDFLPEKVLKQWLSQILQSIIQEFSVCVKEVLENDQKIEESIRKLKKVKDSYRYKNSDDYKIHQQLVIDIQSFYDGMKMMNADLKTSEELEDLLDLLKSLHRPS
ncbi:UNVERIFIED_CONTAM: hypothetical protein PYX00_003587 [Menopon gallinae]|uniref:Conserved oligomeric Golgi complex subunit 2 n=1 Tax=Menopon gallinae TaxID=328185 RepID=A0AAW2I2B0_9NEOP